MDVDFAEGTLLVNYIHAVMDNVNHRRGNVYAQLATNI